MSRSRSPRARQASELQLSSKILSIIVVYDSPRHHPISARFYCVSTEVLAEFEDEVREFFVRKHGISKEVMERCGLQVWRNRAWASMLPSRVAGGKPNTLKTYRIAEDQTLRMADETEDQTLRMAGW